MSDPKCICSHLATDHAVDDDELRECHQCDCVQYEDEVKWWADMKEKGYIKRMVNPLCTYGRKPVGSGLYGAQACEVCDCKEFCLADPSDENLQLILDDCPAPSRKEADI